MQINKRLCFPLLAGLVLLLAGVIPHSAFAQPPAKEAITEQETSAENEAKSLPEAEKLSKLQTIVTTISEVRQRIEDKQRDLKSASGQGREKELIEDIQDLSNELDRLEADFVEVASGVDTTIFSPHKSAGEFSWGVELKELLSPVIRELREATSLPRELDRLRTEIQKLSDQLGLIDMAEENLSALEPKMSELGLREKLNEARKYWKDKRAEVNTQRTIAEEKLRQRIRETASLTDSVRHVFQLFFKSRGRNLLLAILIAFTFWFISGRIHNHIHQLTLRRGYPSLWVRFFNVLSYAVMVAGSMLVFLLSLYFLGDWVLLILATMVLLGLFWASKNQLSRFSSQFMMLLNLGTVREKERVVYGGIPWRVRRINFFSTFENPELEGGTLRLHIGDLLALRSREPANDEPWFPSRKGDWVLLNDGVLARVAVQSPEIVQLVELGGTLRILPATDFISLHPRVLSSGFRLAISFGFDYELQQRITKEIPKALQQRIHETLENEYGGGFRVFVDFQKANASSLDVIIIVDFSGKFAADYFILQYLLQKTTVDLATEKGWNIPFQHVTVHMAK